MSLELSKKATISNPPYNMKWEHPMLAQMQPRFSQCSLPPEGNANFVFVLTALNESDRCVFLLPCGILSGNNKQELDIRKWLVEMNYIEAIILCPANMFENTGIATCILVLDKNKKTSTIEMIDIRDKGDKEIRYQNGQFGGKSHTNRTYKKEINVISDELIDDVINCIQERKSLKNICKPVSIQEIKDNKYKLSPTQYFEVTLEDFQDDRSREYKDIVQDLNRIIREKNTCKLVINETIARNLGFDVELYKEDQKESQKELDSFLTKVCDEKLLKRDYFQTTKNKNEVKFVNNDKEQVSSIFMMIFNMWKQHLYYLNQEENRYLSELRDKATNDLMTGKIEI